jgi:hypothetical protein
MKKDLKVQKLNLSRETLRQLDPKEVGVVGGVILTTNYISCVGNCHTIRIC